MLIKKFPVSVPGTDSVYPGVEGDFLPLLQPHASFPGGFPGSPDPTAEMPVCSADLLAGGKLLSRRRCH